MLSEQQAFNSRARRSRQPQHPAAARDGQVDRDDDRACSASRSISWSRFTRRCCSTCSGSRRSSTRRTTSSRRCRGASTKTREDEIQSLARTQRALSAAIQGLSDELLKQVESLKQPGAALRRPHRRRERVGRGRPAAGGGAPARGAALLGRRRRRRSRCAGPARAPVPARRRDRCASATARALDARGRLGTRELEVSGVRGGVSRVRGGHRASGSTGYVRDLRVGAATCSTSAAAAASFSTCCKARGVTRARHRSESTRWWRCAAPAAST